MQQTQFTLPSQEGINAQLAPIIELIIELKESISKFEKPLKYYRNQELKKVFGLSDNTIIKYRENNFIPYTQLGEIYFYPVDEINKILKKNSNFDLFKLD